VSLLACIEKRIGKRMKRNNRGGSGIWRKE